VWSWLHEPMAAVRFVDVFSDSECRGNALAVFHDADDLSDEQMAAIARWTNLSETTFLCAPTDPAADYRVRIWTTGGELPFAGHPTLGSAHAWVEAGGVPASDEVVVQQCAAGLVRVRRGERLAFAAPPLVRSGPPSPTDTADVVSSLGLDPADVLDVSWVDNGPGWVGVLLSSPAAVLAAEPDPGRCRGIKAGLVAPYPPGSRDDGVAAEVRAFYSDGRDFAEDPVTGSLNAGLAQWLVPAGHLPPRYVAAQGAAIGREGRVHVDVVEGVVWVGGATRTVVVGERQA
jgi:PhzF family phenazine biosynthesis protein